MMTVTDIESALRDALPADMQAHVLPLVSQLAEAINRAHSSQEPHITVEPEVSPLVRELAGQEILVKGALVRFGDGSKLGDVELGDVAGGNVVKLTINITNASHAAPERPQVKRLTWEVLRDICADITTVRTAAVQGKYQADLYLPRDEIRHAFERFLDSSKRGFVLIGSSGVGKSNFLLALGEELHSSRPDICVLMYDGGGLGGKVSVSGVISRDFDERFTSTDERRIKEVWREIDQVEGINERQVVLIVDAINESAQAKELLEQLNELVQKPWRWLKVLFSSRPETWQVIKRHVRLAESLYYREKADQSTPEPFSYSVQMEAFSTQEFRSAYANYQRAFNLQTEYEQLGAELRLLMRDPLNLWLVAKTYEGQSMPYKLEAKQLIGKYVQTLLRDRVLQDEDLQWLDEQLIPQMLEEGQESVSTTQLRAATKWLDTKILVRREEGGEKRLVFRHERFYEYFVRQYLSNEYKKSEDKAAFFAEWGVRIQGNLLLWDMLRDLLARLLEELHSRGPSEEYVVIEKLGDTTNEDEAQLIVSVLTAHYSKHESAPRTVLSTWLKDSRYEGTLAPQITATIAMSCLIEELLAEMLVHPIKEVRYLVIQEIHVLWQKNPQLTKKLLEGLANSIGMKEVVRFAGPQALLQRMNMLWRAFYSLFGLNDPSDTRIQDSPDTLNSLMYASLLLLLGDYTHVGAETETIQVVREIGRPILKSLLLVGGVTENLFKPRRRNIVRWGINHVVNLIKGVERERFTFSFEDSQAFFPASVSQKEVLARLIPHFDAGVGQAPESVEALTTYIEAVARQGHCNTFILYAAMIALIAHIKANPLRTARALDKVLEKLAQQDPPTKKVDQPTGSIWYLMLAYPFMNLSYVDLMDKEPAQAKEVLSIYAKIVRTREIRYRNSWQFECEATATTRLNGLESTLFGYAVGVPVAGPELLEEMVRFYVDNDDHEQIKWSIFQLSLGMTRHKLPTEGRKAITDFIQLLWQTGYLGRLNEEKKAEFWHKSAEDLIKEAGSYREQLIELLEKFEQSGGLPETFKVRIRNANWKESTKLVTREAIIWTLSKGLKDKHPGVRNFIKWFFQTASEVDTIEELALEMAIYLIDFIYDGESLFSRR